FSRRPDSSPVIMVIAPFPQQYKPMQRVKPGRGPSKCAATLAILSDRHECCEYDCQTIWITEGVSRCQREGGSIEVIHPDNCVYFLRQARTTGTARPPSAS